MYFFMPYDGARCPILRRTVPLPVHGAATPHSFPFPFSFNFNFSFPFPFEITFLLSSCAGVGQGRARHHHPACALLRTCTVWGFTEGGNLSWGPRNTFMASPVAVGLSLASSRAS